MVRKELEALYRRAEIDIFSLSDDELQVLIEHGDRDGVSVVSVAMDILMFREMGGDVVELDGSETEIMRRRWELVDD